MVQALESHIPVVAAPQLEGFKVMMLNYCDWKYLKWKITN